MPNGDHDPHPGDDNAPLQQVNKPFWESVAAFGKEVVRQTGLKPPQYDQKKLLVELGQINRASYFATLMGQSTGAIIETNRVFQDKDSSDLAKASAAMKCAGQVSQISALLGPEALIVTALLNVVALILDAFSPQSASMIEQLETLMRQLRGEAVAEEIHAANELMKRQIATIKTLADQSTSWHDLNETAPLTHDISQFTILAASQWLRRPENQSNLVWEEVFVGHAQAMTTVYRLLNEYRLKIKEEHSALFEGAAENIYENFWAQCNDFTGKINKLGKFWHTGIDTHSASPADDLDKPWRGATDWGRFASLAARYLDDEETISGWACTTGHQLTTGAFNNDMKIFSQTKGCVDVAITPFPTYDRNYPLLITSKGDDSNQNGRLIPYVPGHPRGDYTQADADKVQIPPWDTGFMYMDAFHDLILARGFSASIMTGGGKPYYVSLVYLLAKAPNGFLEMGYVPMNDLAVERERALKVRQRMLVSGGRIGVSDHLLFFPSDTSIDYCYHHDFIDESFQNWTQFKQKLHGSMKVEPEGKPIKGGVRDLFACSDDHLLVVLDSGEMWNVTLKPTAERSRALKADEWEWFRLQGRADRAIMLKTPTVTAYEALQDMCRKPPLLKALS